MSQIKFVMPLNNASPESRRAAFEVGVNRLEFLVGALSQLEQGVREALTSPEFGSLVDELRKLSNDIRGLACYDGVVARSEGAEQCAEARARYYNVLLGRTPEGSEGKIELGKEATPYERLLNLIHLYGR